MVGVYSPTLSPGRAGRAVVSVYRGLRYTAEGRTMGIFRYLFLCGVEMLYSIQGVYVETGLSGYIRDDVS